MRKALPLLFLGIAIVTAFGQSRLKQAPAKKPKAKVQLSCVPSEHDLIAGTVGVPQWLLAAKSPNEVFYYNIDWVCVDNVVIRVWIKSLSTAAGNPIASMSRYELKCKANKIRMIRHIEYDKNGDAQASPSDPKVKWEDVVPESVGESILNAVCQKPWTSK